MTPRILIVLAMILVPGVVSAQEYTIELVDRDDSTDTTWSALDAQEEEEFFGRAACCDAEDSSISNSILAVRLKKATQPSSDDSDISVQIWVGSDCDSTSEQTRVDNCDRVDDSGNSVTLEQVWDQEQTIPIDVSRVVLAGEEDDTTCTASIDTDRRLYILADTDGEAGIELEMLYESNLLVDTTPPTGIDSVTTTGVEDAVLVSWDVSSSASSDIEGYQVFCRAENGRALFDADRFERQFRVGSCDEPIIPPTTIDAGTPDAATADAGPEDAGPAPDADLTPTPDANPSPDAGTGSWETLDPSYLCSDAIPSTSTESRVELGDTDLADGELVEVMLVVYDKNGNYTVFTDLPLAGPEPVVDFWESYEGAGGDAKGGYCFVATAAFGDYEHPYVRVLRDFRDGTLKKNFLGRLFIRWYYAASPDLAAVVGAHPALRFTARVLLAPLVILAGAWEYTGPGAKLLVVLLLVLLRLVWRGVRHGLRLPRRAAVALATAAAVILVVGGVASAQPVVFDDDLGDEDEEELPGQQSPWAFEFKLGPYIPGIDDEPGLTSDPYATMFGDDWSLLWQLELDRSLLFHDGGQLGVGLAIGYLSNSAASFKQVMGSDPPVIETDPTTGEPVRAEDDNTFQLLPTALLAVYRFTMIADKTVVPVVPYAKVGLSYYMWWMTKGNGSASSTPTKGDASGGTFGWQGSLGLAFRIDALDRQASQAMRSELDVEHVSLFIEMTYADVKGLGMDEKLYVGDFTWSAGVNFEF